MKLNQKGFTGLELGAIVLVSILLASFVGPILKPFTGGGSGDKSVQKQSHSIKIVPATGADGKPVYVQDSKGNVSPLMQTEESTDASDEQTTPPAPWYDRVISWFIRLGIFGLILALIFPAGAAIAWTWITRRWKALKEAMEAEKEAHATTKTEATKIVLSVDKALDTFDEHINAAKTAYETAKSAAANTTDAAMTMANKAIMETQQAIMNALMNAKQAQLDAMSKIQGEKSSTESFVTMAQSGKL